MSFYLCTALLVCMALLAFFPAGCSPGKSDLEDAAVGQEAAGAPDMGETAGGREIADMAGRTVTLPGKINSAFSTSPTGTIVLYTIDPGLLAGVNYEFNSKEREFILKEYRDLPAYGQGDGVNREAIIAAAPDICITYGTISDATISDTDSFQKQTGIPVVMVDGSLETAAEAYRFLGGVLGRVDRCTLLADYAQEALAFAASLSVPDDKQVSVFYGSGRESLETAPAGSAHGTLLELVHAANVAVVEGEITKRIDISPEQIIGWNPEVIILEGEPTKDVSPADAVKAFKEDARYRGVQAVAEGRVHAIPRYPFSWLDRPPSTNRLLGIYWLADILYPHRSDADIARRVREFYSLFYHLELTDVQLAALLGSQGLL